MKRASKRAAVSHSAIAPSRHFLPCLQFRMQRRVLYGCADDDGADYGHNRENSLVTQEEKAPVIALHDTGTARVYRRSDPVRRVRVIEARFLFVRADPAGINDSRLRTRESSCHRYALQISSRSRVLEKRILFDYLRTVKGGCRANAKKNIFITKLNTQITRINPHFRDVSIILSVECA